MNRPIETPGPQINGQPSIISLLTPDQFKHYPYLTPFRILANAAFESNHGAEVTNGLFPSRIVRLTTDDQLSAELGGNFFMYIISSPIPDDGSGDPPRLYASASGRPYMPKVFTEGVPEDIMVMQRAGEFDMENREVWELKMLIVDPTLQKQGLATLLLNLVEAEIVKRVAGKQLQLSKIGDVADGAEKSNGEHIDVPKNKKVIITLDTIREINEEYYVRRGFVTTEIRPQKTGTFGSNRGWEAVWMQKEVTV
ncbi:hypothetical protein FRB94_002262 [Tulasnella sp. JGI-2019a]|nr:hypothetical protein FRB93_004072 [Tulasnella sp. JGI-2019a]KAG9004586.1 hypothetical protein FRB94_002262 [Tulasnella sp. JGI-2019a]KAG9031144.1 hypothetical protein FRB95_003118 [Tulasnella sp. JGI-2019a]